MTLLTPELEKLFLEYLALDTSRQDGQHYRPAVELLGDYLKKLDFEISYYDIPSELCPGPNRVHLVARRTTDSSKPTLLIYNHIDVVPATYEQAFRPTKRDGRIYGRGAADMKGGTMAVLAALHHLHHKPTHFNLVFWATTDEETDQLAQLRHVQPLLDLPTNTIVFDPDTLAGGITVANLGAIQFTLEIAGTSVHSAMSHLGKNAIEQAARMITEFWHPVRLRMEKQRSRFATPPGTGLDVLVSRCNVNMIQGGTAPNILPDVCQLTVDCRVIPDLNTQVVHDQLVAEFTSWAKKHRIQLTVKKTLMLAGSSCSHPFAHELDQVYRKISGEGGQFGAPGSTPLAQFAEEAGWPHVGLGVIRPDNHIHGVDEWVTIKDIEEVASTLVRIL